jgi:beta-barrel assembly-enhancing protease
LTVDCFPYLYQQERAYAFSVGDEKEYGEKMLAVIRKEFNLIDDLDVVQYIVGIGSQIVVAAGPQYFNYHFYVINNKEFNAFAAPSGLIFIHSGIIGAMKTEGELVSVVAHEIGHVMSRHIADRIDKTKKVSAGTLAMVLAGILVGGGALSQALITGGLATGEAMYLQFTRENEEEADRIGFALMQDLNRDPQDMVSMLNTMYKVSRIRMGNIPQYLLTHPKPELRMGYVQDLIYVHPNGNYASFDQFHFKRIQHRMASLSEDPNKLKARYNREIRNAEDQESKVFAQYGLALVYLEEGEYGRAIEGLTAVNNFFHDKVNVWVDLGRAYLSNGELNQAFKYFDKARNSDPGNWYAAYYLALALEKKGEIVRAEQLYRQVQGHVPDYPPVYLQLAKIAGDQGDTGLSHFYLGLSFFYDGNFSSSQFHFSKAQEIMKSKEKLEEIAEKQKQMKELK